jgi:uncharacterized membrane protein YdjX (TVP38/TMEM64 family)
LKLGRRALARIGVLTLVSGALATLYLSGFFEFIRQPEQVRATLEDLGLLAPVLFVVAFSLLEPFFIPGIAFMIPGALIFPFPQLFLLSWLGSIGAGIVGFSFARFVGREYIESRLPARLRRFDERLVQQGLRTVILVRLTLFLAPPAHWLLGLSKVRFGAFVLGTAIGFLPGIALASYLIVFAGESLGDWLSDRPPRFWLAAGLGVAALLMARRRRARRREQSPESAAARAAPESAS